MAVACRKNIINIMQRRMLIWVGSRYRMSLVMTLASGDLADIADTHLESSSRSFRPSIDPAPCAYAIFRVGYLSLMDA
jgi:hypothetical protein